jgi:membrane-bound metal-dependent hydrolase YbcI (DUF457 family)
MPYTPLHLGPGLAIKALAGRHFSLLSFAVAQVVMDIEPLIGLIRGADVLHGASHPYAAALVIGAIVAVMSIPVRRLVLPLWNRELAFHRLAWFSAPRALGPIPVLAGAFVATFSHVLLDRLMHADMSPLAPWAGGNRLLGMLSDEAPHQLCVLSGLLGFTIWVALAWRGRTVS